MVMTFADRNPHFHFSSIWWRLNGEIEERKKYILIALICLHRHRSFYLSSGNITNIHIIAHQLQIEEERKKKKKRKRETCTKNATACHKSTRHTLDQLFSSCHEHTAHSVDSDAELLFVFVPAFLFCSAAEPPECQESSVSQLGPIRNTKYTFQTTRRT